MANASVSYDSELPDVDGQTIRCRFQGVTLAAREVKRVTLTGGSGCSSAMLSVPYLAVKADEVAFNIALKASGPAAALKLLARAQFDICDLDTKATLPILTGFMVQRHHVFYESGTFDQMNVNILDDKWPLTKYRISGRYEYDPDSGAHYYNSGGRCVFNQNGFRSLFDTKFGPRFSARDNSGYNANYGGETSQEPAPGYATKTPRTWRPVDVARYHFDTKFAARLAVVPKSQYFMGDQQIGKYIVVPRGLENILTDRPLRDVNHDGMSVLDALVDTFRRSGSFDLAVRATGAFVSELQIIDCNPNHHFPIYLPGYTVNTVAAAMGARNLVKAGSLVEDVSERYPAVNLMGDNPAVEFMASTDNTGTGAGLLQYDWSWDEESKYKQYIESNDDRGGVIRSSERFDGANRQYDRVYCAYKIKDGADIFANTKYAGVRIGGKNPVLMATQLTAWNSEQSPAGWQPKQIIVEAKMTPAEFAAAQLQHPTIPDLSPWVPCGIFDGLQLTPDGKTILLPGLRARGPATDSTWYTKPGKNGESQTDSYGYAMRPREMRLNVAVEGDFPAFCLNATDPNIVAHRFDGAAPKFTLQMRSGPLAFVDWERTANSRPVGEGGISQRVSIFTDKAQAGNELFSDFSGPPGNPDPTSRAARMTAAKINDVNRVLLHGNLDFIGLNGVIVPGYPVQLAGDVMDGITGIIKAVTYDVDTQTTQAVFGSHDVSTLFELKGGAMPQGSGGASITSAPPPTKTDDKYSDPKTPSSPGDSYKQDTSKMDDYEKADAARNAPTAASPAAAAAAQSPSSAAAGATTGDGNPSDKRAGGAGRIADAKAARADAKEKHDARHPGIGEDGLGFGRPNHGSISDGRGGAQKSDIMHSMFGKPNSGSISNGRGGPQKSNIMDSMFGKASSGSATAGAKGQGHREWDTDKTAGKQAGAQQPKPAAPPPKPPPPPPKAPAAPAKAAPAQQQNLSIPDSKPSAPRQRAARPPEDE